MKTKTATLLLVLAGLLLAGARTFSAELVNADRNAKVALQAYDPVAFFTDSKATKGSPFISTTHGDYRYFFASEEHKAAFEKAPEKYLPAYGGYCAYGISVGKLFPVEIETWEIVDGRLLLQFNQSVKTKFAEHKAENLKNAEMNWPELVAKHSK